MTVITPDEVYTAKRVRSGVTLKGPWELIVVVDERGKNEITLFPVNVPSRVEEGGRFRILEIRKVKAGFKKKDDGSWSPNTTADVLVEPIVTDVEGFEDDGDPWDSIGDDLPL